MQIELNTNGKNYLIEQGRPVILVLPEKITDNFFINITADKERNILFITTKNEKNENTPG